ncbi:23S rRNA m(2)A-2503 methyltransferase [Anaerobranca californiensis DSM 14826]|jgi:23S rRNA (adenine2503-C2)-methyltransferase|uniref:Probable dual-specificity RNA methyltransferase RlmN n=1 Tax=Anaerobranca californiensis DSM 14826 TaxID=1120989 RepID=A0A1M6KQH3_9FIRM|nr:23S rRNA (adenine(2503)-C(2))-methyltransferase RlmN [Anaerobranca californiensis]SHJ61161.1 23S rRNA m(2)A-2503 methyltransferase [Anaerobranca californiensis DSM 14826]
MINVLGLNEEQLAEKMAPYITQKFRIKQIFDWIYKKRVNNFMEMSNLPQKLREELSNNFVIGEAVIKDKQVSKDGTVKYLFKFRDGSSVETVLMNYTHGLSICISTQVGCKLGCVFCNSGSEGFYRNLSASEMVEQFWQVQRLTDERISNLVLMGIGEPLDNYDNVMKFIRFINSEATFNIGIRNITLSTAGLVPEIYKLADEGLGITLALSLHAADDEKRREIMPIAKRYTISELITACKYFVDQRKRRVTIEYIMIKGFNDTEKDAFKLAKVLSGLLCNINLIPINNSYNEKLERSSEKAIERFQKILTDIGFEVTIRRELGSDIDAACGQLRKKS